MPRPNVKAQRTAKPSAGAKGWAAFSREPTFRVSMPPQTYGIEFVSGTALFYADMAKSIVDG